MGVTLALVAAILLLCSCSAVAADQASYYKSVMMTSVGAVPTTVVPTTKYASADGTEIAAAVVNTLEMVNPADQQTAAISETLGNSYSTTVMSALCARAYARDAIWDNYQDATFYMGDSAMCANSMTCQGDYLARTRPGRLWAA